MSYNSLEGIYEKIQPLGYFFKNYLQNKLTEKFLLEKQIIFTSKKKQQENLF